MDGKAQKKTFGSNYHTYLVALYAMENLIMVASPFLSGVYQSRKHVTVFCTVSFKMTLKIIVAVFIMNE